MEKNIFDTKITSFAFGGAGIGKLPDGKVCFVRGTAPGELVKAELVKEYPSYACARLLAVKLPAPERITPECPLAPAGRDGIECCPGCSYAHVRYETELLWKQRQLEDFLLRGHLVEKHRIRRPEPAPVRYGWRNKIRLTCGSGPGGKEAFGYRGNDNRTIVDVPDCLLARKSIREALALFRENKQGKNASHVTFRWTLHDGVLIRPDNDRSPRRLLREQLGKFGTFHVPENSFFQINVPMAVKLAEAAVDVIKTSGASSLLELFCGTGVFSLAAAQSLPRLRTAGVEQDRLAVQAAQRNAKDRGFANRCRYCAGDAGSWMDSLARNMVPERTMVLADPPRCGLTGELCAKILSYAPRAILYISCAPDTLRRDLKIFSDGGYEICGAKLFDLFPRTAHFETMTVLRKRA